MSYLQCVLEWHRVLSLTREIAGPSWHVTWRWEDHNKVILFVLVNLLDPAPIEGNDVWHSGLFCLLKVLAWRRLGKHFWLSAVWPCSAAMWGVLPIWRNARGPGAPWCNFSVTNKSFQWHNWLGGDKNDCAHGRCPCLQGMQGILQIPVEGHVGGWISQ